MAYNIKINSSSDISELNVTTDTKEFLKELFDGVGPFSLGSGSDENRIKIPRDVGREYVIDGGFGSQWVPGSPVEKLVTSLKEKYQGSTIKGVLAGSGSNSSSLSTKEQEIITAIHCIIKVKRKQLNKDSFIEEYNNIVFGSKDVPTADKLYTKSTSDKTWIKSFDIASNKFANKFKGHNLKVLYGTSKGILGKIYNHAKKLMEKEGYSFDINKWSPADVWFCTDELNQRLHKLIECKDIHTFNTVLLELLRMNILIPVSLKKVGDSGNISIVNDIRDNKGKNVFDVSPKDLSSVKITNIGTTVEKFSNSKDIYLKCHSKQLGDISIQLRTFQSDGTNFSAEIKAGKGSKANHGKIGIVIIQDLLNSAAGNRSHATFFKEYSEVKKKLKNPTGEIVQEFYSKWVYLKNNMIRELIVENNTPFTQYMYTTLNESSNIEYEQFYSVIKGKSIDWLVSKYLALNTAWHLVKLKDDNKIKKFILDLYRTASSQHEISAPYYKIS